MSENTEKAYFGGGCFWCMEPPFEVLDGVLEATSGYMGGETENPTYEEVCTGKTNHAEVVEIYFDPLVIPFKNLLSVFWANHNPTTINQQGPDIGVQYRSVIYYTTDKQKKESAKSLLLEQDKWNDKIVTEINKSLIFYRAEEYHQNYLNKNNISSCGL